MGVAGRKGKFAASASPESRDVAWERYEDVLTADVLGAFRFLPPELGLLPVLSKAVDEHGQTFKGYLERWGVAFKALDVARIKFWPTFPDRSEPDALVRLESTVTDDAVSLLVEAKLWSGQHEIGTGRPVSQIGHYLALHLAGALPETGGSWPSAGCKPLLFVTSHTELPTHELARARREVRDSLPELPAEAVGIFWLSWGAIGEEAKAVWDVHRDNCACRPWLRHLLDVYDEVRVRDLLPRVPFSGVSRPPASWHRTAAAFDGYSRAYDLGPPVWPSFPITIRTTGS